MSVRIKVCGITNRADAEQAAAMGADMIGLNFYAKSLRCIDTATAKSIVAILPSTVEPVALVVDESLSDAQHIARSIGVATVQWHGEHGDRLLAGTRWIAAFPVRDASSLQQIAAWLDRLRTIDELPAAILVDAHVPGMHGGTGQTAPWQLLADFHPGVPLILAGGLTPDNVADAIRIVRPYAVDVASGVESRPGVKDHDKMRRFIEAVRSVDLGG